MPLARQEDMSTYHFTPLESPRHIRVVHLRPAASLTAPLCGVISSVGLAGGLGKKAGINYTALSYSWDAQQPSQPISIDGRTLYVTPNCEAAMRRLRARFRVEVLWIDSICIDQSPEAVVERNQQVALMGDVYKQAKRVVIWLGESDNATDQAIKTIKIITDKKFENEIARGSRVRELNKAAERIASEPLMPILGRSWFDRMWTIQEATLPMPSRVQIQIGSSSMMWSNLMNLGYMLANNGYNWGAWEETLMLQLKLTSFLAQKRAPDFPWKRFPDGDMRNNFIQTILLATKDKKATKPEDKVFALYSLFKELSCEIPEPDYRKPIEVIYREATVASIEHDRALNILYYAPSNNRRSGMASWVPDWNDPAWPRGDSRFPADAGKFQASGGSDPFWVLPGHDDTDKLIVAGRIFDRVVCRSATMPSNQTWLEDSRTAGVGLMPTNRTLEFLQRSATYQTIKTQAVDVFRAWLEVMGHESDYYHPTGESTTEAFRRTITMNHAKDTEDHRSNIGQTIPKCEQQIKPDLKAIQTFSSQSSSSELLQILSSARNSGSIIQKATDKVERVGQSSGAAAGAASTAGIPEIEEEQPRGSGPGSLTQQLLDQVKQVLSNLEIDSSGRPQGFDEWVGILRAPESEITTLATTSVSPILPGLAPAMREIYLRYIDRMPLSSRISMAFSGGLDLYNRSLMELNRGKCFFRTAEGYVGTAPDPACVRVEEGDAVAVVAGLNQPVLLRPVVDPGGSSHWRFLTHVYVHGIMHGEAWPGSESGQLKGLILV
ncbi:Heterokaryon incompatibility protein (HET) domain containing protein [Hyaloscypha variabilis]